MEGMDRERFQTCRDNVDEVDDDDEDTGEMDESDIEETEGGKTKFLKEMMLKQRRNLKEIKMITEKRQERKILVEDARNL